MFPFFHEWIWNDCVDNDQIAQTTMSKKCHVEVRNATKFEQGENRMEMVMGSVFDKPHSLCHLKIIKIT